MKELAIGIDLGTTNCCVGIYKNEKIEIIINKQGNRTTPSYIYINDESDEIIVGEDAKNKTEINNVIYDIKRLIGLKYEDKNVQQNIKHMTYKIIDDNGEIKIEINKKKYSPIEISSMLLKEMKDIAENYTGEIITKAVITVPAYFNDAQRQATKDAGELAGLTILRIINEPTAASIAYGIDKKNNRNILVYDLGGGTLDVSLLNIEKNIFEVIATAGDTKLGGEDLNNELVIYCLKEFKRKNKNINVNDLMRNKKVIHKLRRCCEDAKIILSKKQQTSLEIDSLYDGYDFSHTLTRAKFEDICMNVFNRCLKPVTDVLNESNLSIEEINDIVLVGGSTRIPKIYNMLKEYFKKDPHININPDEAIAYGAALQASILSNLDVNNKYELVLMDVVSLSVGIETDGGLMANIIKKNTKIPCTFERIFSTFTNNQPDVIIKVYEGERKFIKHNNLLGEFILSNIPPMQRGEAKIHVKFTIDVNGILNVSAKEESTNISNNITIKKTHITSEKLENIICDAEKMHNIEKIEKETILARKKLENYISNIRCFIGQDEYKNKLNESEYKELNEKLIEIIQWYTQTKDLSKNKYETKFTEIENYIKPKLLLLFQSKIII